RCSLVFVRKYSRFRSEGETRARRSKSHFCGGLRRKTECFLRGWGAPMAGLGAQDARSSMAHKTTRSSLKACWARMHVEGHAMMQLGRRASLVVVLLLLASVV